MANYNSYNTYAPAPTQGQAPAQSRGNSLAPKQGQEKFSTYIGRADIRVWLNNVLGDQKSAQKFVANITSAIATSPKLAECEPSTIVSSALLANSLNLSMSNSLGHCYLVPFKDTKNRRTVATFVLGYKGIIQLATRSGQYLNINVAEVRQGELKRWNSFTEEISLDRIEDDEVREETPVIGYFAYFKLVNGFTKQIYWSKEKMQNHADHYSKAYSKEADKRLKAGQIPLDELWKYSSFWYTDFDGMAFKTMLRQIIGKWGPMDTELQKAFESDADEDEKTEYFSKYDYSANGERDDQLDRQAAANARQAAEQDADDAEFDFFAEGGDAEALRPTAE